MKREILRLDWVCKSFDLIPVLKYINLNLYAGEIHAIMGLNGVGKSTLTRIVSGQLRPDGGRIWFAEHSIFLGSVSQAERYGIYRIDSIPEIVEQFDTAGNFNSLLRPKRRSLLYNEADARRQAVRLIEEWGLRTFLDPEESGYRLSVLKRQMIHFLCAAANGARVLVMDEPFSSLSSLESAALKSLMVKARDRGLSILMTSHSLPDVCEIANRVTFLRDGSCAATMETPRDLRRLEELAALHMMVTPVKELSSPPSCPLSGEELFRADGCRLPGLESPFSFHINKGEILGIVSFGAFQRSVCAGLFGMNGPPGGDFWLEGRTVSLNSPEEALRAGIGMAGDGGCYQENFWNLSISQNITLPFLCKLFPRHVLRPKVEEFVSCRFQKFLKPDQIDARFSVRHLSSGFQKRLSLARWFAVPQKLILLADPCKSLDTEARGILRNMICQYAEHGVGFVLEFSRYDELLCLCSSALVFNNGHLLGMLRSTEITQECILSMVLSDTLRKE